MLAVSVSACSPAPRQDVAAARHESVARQRARPGPSPTPGGTTREGRAGHDGREVGGRPDQVDGQVVRGVVGVEADRRPGRRLAAQVGLGAGESRASDASGDGAAGSISRSQLRTTSDGAQRAAVGERQAGAEVEDDPPAVVVEPPRFGQGRAELQVGVERRQRLEQLGA